MRREFLIWLALAALVTWEVYDHRASSSPPPPLVSPSPQAAVNLAQDEQATVDLFKRLSPSVVYIATSNVQQDFFTMNLMQIPRGTGSGFVWDEKGHVVTNFHVIQGADEVEVVLSDQSRWSASVIGAEPDKDLAVLRLKTEQKLSPIELGRSDPLQVGQRVYAIGNPFGMDQTLTTGVISGLGREIESVTRRPIQGVIQTDAAINPGNSGGPLLDSAGRLIGVNTAIYSPSGAYAGIGFAVPVDTVRRLVPQLIEFGRVKKPGLGISIAPDALVSRAGLSGILVLQVASEGPAAKAGLQPTHRDQEGHLILGDIITALDGQPLKNSADLFRVLDQCELEQKVTLTLQRGGQEVKVEVVLSAVSS